MSKQKKIADSSEIIRGVSEYLLTYNPSIDAKGVTVTIEGICYKLPLSVKASQIGYLMLKERFGESLTLATYRKCIEKIILYSNEKKQNYEKGRGELLTTTRIKVPGATRLYVTDAGIGIISKGEEGETFIPLWPIELTPIVHRRIHTIGATYEGGATAYDIEIGGERHTITVGQIKKGTWVDLFPCLQGVLSTSGYSKYVDCLSAIAALSPLVECPQTTGYYNLGNSITPNYVYLLPDNRVIDATGEVSKRENIFLAREILSKEGKELWDTLDIPTECSLEEIDAFIVWAKTIGPKFYRILAHGISAMVSGISSPSWGMSHAMNVMSTLPGQGKTALCATARGIWPYKFKPLCDASYQDTISGMEDALSLYTSFPTIVDDLTKDKTENASSSIEEGKKADRLARSLHDQKPARRRMTSTMQRQKDNLIKTCFFNTWEAPPTLPESYWRRTTTVLFQEGDIPIKSDGSGKPSLEGIETHWNTKVYLFKAIIVNVLQSLNEMGMEVLVARHQTIHQRYEQWLHKQVIARWEIRYPGIPLPGDYHNLTQLYSYELLGLALLEQVTNKKRGIIPFVQDAIIDGCVDQMVKLSGMKIDEEGVTDIEVALTHVLEKISTGQTCESHKLHIVAYTTAKDDFNSLPVAYREDGSKVPDTQYGDKPSFTTNSIIVAWMKEEVTYISAFFRKMLQKELGLASETSLTRLLDKTGWIQSQNNGRKTHLIYPNGSLVPRVLALRNKKLWPLMGIASFDKPTEVSNPLAKASSVFPTKTDIDDNISILDLAHSKLAVVTQEAIF